MMEEVLVYVDFATKVDNDLLLSSDFKIIGLEDENPILQLGGQVFKGEWQDVCGTQLFFKEKQNTKAQESLLELPEKLVEFVYKTDKKLVMKRVFPTPKTPGTEEPDASAEVVIDDEPMPGPSTSA